MQGRFPSELKIVKTTPALRSDDRNAIENFKQISVLSSLSKIIETVVVEQISE